jgi:hypothetical protein
MSCPAMGHCPDPDDGRAAAFPGCAMIPVIAAAMVTVAIPMSAVRALVSLRNIRFMLFSLVGWLASAPWPGPDGASLHAHDMSTALRCEALRRRSMKSL